MKTTLLLIVALALAGCSSMSNRPDTAQAKACTAQARTVADSKESQGDRFNKGATMVVMMVWLGNEEDAYNACVARG